MNKKNTSTRKGRNFRCVATEPYQSLTRFADMLKLRSLSDSTRHEYSRYVRKLAERVKRDPATLDEAELRAHLLRLKTEHHYSPSTMRTAVCAMRNFYGHLLGHDWKLFDLVRSPDRKTLPAVLTRQEVARLFGAIKEQRFRTILRLIYVCGLRIREATTLQVSDIKAEPPRLHLHHTKGQKERYVPLPPAMLRELRAYWRTHRNPQWVFPGLGRGWREGPGGRERLAQTAEPMGVASIQHCMRLLVAEVRLPKGTCPHTLRHSYATHLIEAGVSIRLLAKFMGHSSIETTAIYAHLTAVNEAHACEAAARLLDNT